MAGRVLGFRFAAIPVDMIDQVSSNALHAFAVLSKYASQDRRAFPGRKVLAESMDCSLDTVDRAMKELQEGDWVRLEHNFSANGSRTANTYWLFPFATDRSEVAADTRLGGRKNRVTPSRTKAATEELDPDVSRTRDLAIAPPAQNTRERDLIFEAVAEACEMDWRHLTPTARSQLGRAVKEIKEAGDATPDEIRWRASVYHQRLPDCPLTPPAFMKWWPTCSERPLTQTDRNLMEILEDRRRERVRGSKDRESHVLDVPHWEDDDGDPDDLDRESYAP